MAGERGAMVEAEEVQQRIGNRLMNLRNFPPWCFETFRFFMTMSILRKYINRGGTDCARHLATALGELPRPRHLAIALGELPRPDREDAEGAIFSRFNIETVDETQLLKITNATREFNQKLRGEGWLRFISNTVGRLIGETAIWKLYTLLEKQCEYILGHGPAVEADDYPYELLKTRLDHIALEPSDPFRTLRDTLLAWVSMMVNNSSTRIYAVVSRIDIFFQAIITGEAAKDIIDKNMNDNMDELWKRLELTLDMIDHSNKESNKESNTDLIELLEELRRDYKIAKDVVESRRLATTYPSPSSSLSDLAKAMLLPMVATAAAATAAYAATHAGGKYRKSRRQRARPTKRRARSLAKKRASQRKRRATKMKKKMKKKKSRKGRR